jgi:enamine deaminase RidA (YjgF/YER057c/UK114 family)
MPKRFVNPPTLSRSTYSHAAVVEGGTLIVTAGQVAFDGTGKVVGVGDIKAQTHQVYANLREALRAAGADFADVIKVTTYVTDPPSLAIARDIRMTYFSFPEQPASTGLVVSRLAHPDLLIEVEMMAFVDRRS